MTSVFLGITKKSCMQPFIQCARVCKSNSMGALHHQEDDVVKFDSLMPSMSLLENALSSRIFHTGSYAGPVGFCLGRKIVLFLPKSRRCASGGGAP